MSGRRGKEQRDGPLQGHFKEGRVYRPPLPAYENTHPNDWVKEDLPDLLWVVLLVAHDGADGLIRFRTLQEAIIARIGPERVAELGAPFDGRLTSFDRIAEDLRPVVLDVLASRRDVVPDELIRLLRLYPGAPARWLLVEPYLGEHLEIEADDALNDLAQSIAAVAGDGHRNALVKCAPIGWRVLAGKMTISDFELELLRNYPSDEATRSQADAVLRSEHASGDEDDCRLRQQRGWNPSHRGNRQEWSLRDCG